MKRGYIVDHPINQGEDSLILQKKIIPLCHEQSRTISIGAVDSAIRDTFKF